MPAGTSGEDSARPEEAYSVSDDALGVIPGGGSEEPTPAQLERGGTKTGGMRIAPIGTRRSQDGEETPSHDG